MAEWQILGDTINVGGVHRGCAAEMAAAFGILGLGQVPEAGMVAHNFASASDLEPLGHGLFRFDAFGSSHKS
jgi:hypothetical protein